MSTVKILNSAESVEWYTPARYIEAVQKVLGGIELDPASCVEANLTVKARRIWTREDDGLKQNWSSKTLFLNPPYGKERGKSRAKWWSEKLIEEFESGRVGEAVLLVNASTSERWFQPLWDYTICFTDHRIKFNRPDALDKKKGGGTKGQAFVYFGNRRDEFREVFEAFGVVRWESLGCA